MSRNVIQYEVWKECHNRCTFCFLAEDTIYTPKEVKLSGIQNAIDQIKHDVETGVANGVALIGGDFWQGEMADEEVRIRFFELLKLCYGYLRDKKLNAMWLTATLTIGDQHDLYKALDLFEEMVPNAIENERYMWLCTSYDTIGRFHTPKMLETWEYHMKNIGEKYPNVHKNSSLIITNDLVKKTLSGEFDFVKFEKEFGTEIYMKTPSHHFDNMDWKEGKKKFNDIVGDFFLERTPTIEFLQKLNETQPRILEKIMNNELRANSLVGHSNKGDFDLMVRDQKDIHKNISSNPYDAIEKAQIEDCGHEKQYQCYIDCEKCFMCDLQRIFKIL